MAINLASRLSAITVDFAGVNHIVWLEDNAIWHAQYNANAGTWVNAQRLVEGLTESVSSLNLVANPQLIGSGSSAAPGLAVIWQAGDKNVNSSNFYYSAAQYGSNGQLQWDASPTALTVNATDPTQGSGLPFANLAPRVITDSNGKITVVGQQVNVSNAANQTIREDTDLYATSFNIISVNSATTATPDAFYAPPVLANGVNQAAGIPVNQSANSAQASVASFTDSDSVTAQSALFTASSTNQQAYQGLGFKYGPSLTFSTGLFKALGLEDYISGIPGGLLRLVMEPYDLVGNITGSGLFGSELSIISQGIVEKFTGELGEKEDPSRFFEKTKKGISISFGFNSKTSYDTTPPYYLASIEDVLAISLLDKIPILNKPAGLWAGKLDFIGSVGLAAVLELESSSGTTDTLLQLVLDDAALNLPSILLGFISAANLSEKGKNGIAGALIAATVFGPLEDILIGNLTDSANLTISNYLVGPTMGADVEGLLLLAEAIRFTAAAGVELFFGFGQGGNETTVLRIPLEVGVGLGPIGLSLSIEPTWVWPNNPPLTNTGTTTTTAISAGDLTSLTTLNGAMSASSETPAASVAGTLLTLTFDQPLDVSSVPSTTDFQLQTQASNQTAPVAFAGTIGTITVSNDATTNNGVVVLQLSQPLVYSPQFNGPNPQSNGEAGIFLTYTGTALEFSDDTPVAQFETINVTNNSPQSLAAVFNPTTGNGQNYSVGNQQPLLGANTLEADYAQDSPPALALVGGDVLAVWSREVQPLTPIAGFVNANEAYLNFVQNLGDASTTQASQFTVCINGTGVTCANGNTGVTVTNVSIEDGYVKLNLSENVLSSDIVTISYSPSTSQTNNLFLTDAVQSLLWIPAFSETLTNTTSTTTPAYLGGSAIISNNGANNLVTLIFNGLLNANTPNNSQFTVVSNGQTYPSTAIGNVTVSGNTVTFTLAPPTTSTNTPSPLISQGDIVTVSYTSGSEPDQNLAWQDGTFIPSGSTSVATLPETPTTTLMAGFNTPNSKPQNIPGTDGFNSDPAVAADSNGNALAVWVYADSSDLVNLLTPGEFYTDNQTQIIINALNESDINFSYYNGTQWSIAATLGSGQSGTDSNVTVAYDAMSQSYIAAWLNTQQPTDSSGEPTTTIYWASYDPILQSWSSVNTVLSESTPDPLTDLVISSVDGNPALFWTETQPISYSQLTTQNNPELYFRLGELAGTTAQNQGILGSMANGTFNGSFTLKEAGALFDSSDNSGDPNPAVLFSNGGSMTIGGALLTSGGSAFSVEFWFNIPEAVTATNNLVDLDGVFSVALNEDNGNTTLTFSLDNTTGSTIATSSSSNPIDINTWYYVVGTYSNQTQELSLYLDGQQVGTLGGVSFTTPANATFTIAGGTNDIVLDEVAVYSNVLSYSPTPPSNTTNSLDLLNIIFNTDQIGEKYAAQYVAPLPPGPQAQVSFLNSAGTQWTAQSQVNPLPFFQPTTLSDANSTMVDVVSSTTPNSTGNISPNGQQDTIFRTNNPSSGISGFQGKTIESITLDLSNGITYSVGIPNTSNNQLGVVIGNSLINSTAPNATFSYPIMGSELVLDLLVDTGSNPSASITVNDFTITFTDGTIATFSTDTTIVSDLTAPTFIPPNSVPVTAGNEPVLGTATVTEVEDSSLSLIDSGLVINTTNPAMGYAVASADFNNDGRSDVAVGNRGYTTSSGANLNNGTVQILMGGQPVLNGPGGPLSPPTSTDTSSDASGNTGGFAIVGIPDSGQANGDSALSLTTGDVNNDNYVDLIIGSPNNSTVYVVYGSYLASAAAQTLIDVSGFTTNTSSSQGYAILSPNGTTSGDLFGFAVTAGQFDSTAGADIAIGAPNASWIPPQGGDAVAGVGSVYVAYNGLSESSSLFTGSFYTYTTANFITGGQDTNQVGERAGYALTTSAYNASSSTTFSGSRSYDDLIVGAPNHTISVSNNWTGSDGLPTSTPNPFPDTSGVNVGAVYVFTVVSDDTTTTQLSSLPSFTYYGTSASTPSDNGAAQPLFAGSALASGDWNGDKQLDLAVAAPAANQNSGAVYVLSGKAASASGNPQYLNQVSNLTLNGGLALGQAGTVVAWAGDVNDDSYEDLLVTAPQGANAIGQGYVVFGGTDLLAGAGETNLMNLSPIASDSKSTFLLNGNFPYQLTGQAAAAIGDINGDGVDDLMMTAPNANQLYAVYGHPWLADDGSIKLADISGDNGVVTDGTLYTAVGAEPVGPTNAVNIGGDQSSLAPALIINGGVSYLAYVDVTSNLITLVTSTDLGDTWSTPLVLPSSATTSQSPALAFFQGDLYLAYVGSNNEINLTYSSNDGQDWSDPYEIGQTSSAGVSLAVYQDQLLAFFVADDPSSRILYTYSDQPQAGAWSTDYVVTYQDGSTTSNQTSSLALSSTVMGETLYVAYRGGTVGSAGGYYVTGTSGSDLANLSWDVSELSAANANSAPGITNDGNQLYFTYSDTSQYLLTAVSSSGNDWSSFNVIQDISSNEQPAPATLGGNLYLGLLGNAETASVYFTSTSFNQPLDGTGNKVVMLGDVNGDGFADTLAAGSPYGAILTFGASTQDLLDAATGTDELIVTIAAGGLIQTVMATGDFNGDGLADFGVIDQNKNFYFIPGSANLGPLQALTLTATPGTSVSGTTNAVATGDYNGDGYDDLLLTVSNQVQLYTGNGAGTLSTPLAFTAGSNTVFNAIGDVNGDGYDDIGGGAPSDSNGNGGGTVYLGNAAGVSALSPPSAAASAYLNNSSWQNFTYTSQQTKFNAAPSFAVFNGYLYMAYTGVSESSQNGSLYVQRSADGYNWEGLTNFGSGFEASTGFSLINYNGALGAAYLDQYGELIYTYADPADNDLGLTFNSSNNFNTGTYTKPSYVTPVLVSDSYNLYMYYATGNNSSSQTIGSWNYPNFGGPWNQDSSIPTPPSANLPLGASFALTAVDDTLYISFATDSPPTTTTGLTLGSYNQGNPWSFNTFFDSGVLRGTGLLSVGDTLYNFYLPSSGDINVTTSTDNGTGWSAPSQVQAVSNQYWLTYPNPVYFNESIFLGYGVQLAENYNVDVSYAISNPIYQPNLTQQFGEQLKNIGDFNGDGIADFAVLAPGFFAKPSAWNNQVLENNQGAVLIYYGSTGGFNSSSNPDVVLATPAPSASTNVANNQALLLAEMAPAGDVNGDGYDDLIIASPTTANDSENTTDGLVFVVFGGGESLWGNTYPATQPFNLGNLTPDVSQLTLYFTTPLNTGNLPPASAFNVTNGLSSVINVTGLAFSNPNELTLTLASDANVSDSLSVAYTVPSSGPVLTYASGAIGTNVAGFLASNDAVIASLGAPTIDIETYTQYGFSITGLPGSQSGISLDGGGDVNGDGFSDFLIGAPGDDDSLAYTLFGSDFNQTVNQTGTIGDDVMVGSPTGESFVAGQGDDLIVTGGGVDVAYAGPGDDQVIVNDLYFQRLDGGAGTDALFFYGYNGQDWDLTTLSPGTRLRDFEVLVTENYGSNTLTLNAISVLQISPTNSITLFMDGTDSLVLSSDFSYSDIVYQYNQNFSQYLSSVTAARVLVNQPNTNSAGTSQVTFSAPSTNSPSSILPSEALAPAASAPSVATAATAATAVSAPLESTPPSLDHGLGSTSISGQDSITASDAAPGLSTQIFVSNPTVSERTGRAQFTLTRTGDLSAYTWFDYYTQDGDAKAGNRYTPVAGEAVFAPGETTITITVPIPNNAKNVGTRQFGLAVMLEGDSSDPAAVPDAWRTAVSSPKEQIRRWTLIPGDDSNSITFDVTSAQSTDHIVTLDMDLEGLVIPLIWNPTTLTYDNLPFSNTNGIAESQDINGDLTSDLYRLKFQDGGPFDGDTIVNGLVSLNFEIAQLTPIDVPTTGGIVSGTEANDYLNAQLSTGTNRLSGLGGMDVLIGSPQRDVLTGGSGNDRLYGKAGVDQLYGEAGDDILDGGLAMDLLYGGAGADSFVLRAGDGPDRVMDFNAIDGDLFLLDNLTFGALSFQGNRTFLGAELLATVIDNLGLPVTTLGSNPQWFVTT